MSLVTAATSVIERMPIPDAVTSAGISFLVDRTRRKLARGGGASEVDFARLMAEHPIAVRPDAANEQHYEVAPAFFGLALGPRRKYSCCLYRSDSDTLATAEEHALAETAEHAALADGQDILELGCGWGSLSLWMAERYPGSRITAVSNSRPQRAYIEGEAAKRGFANLRVITADMNDFAADGTFDRIVSVEMFEHMTNWQSLLRRIHGWLRPDGRLFLHVFSHRSAPYLFDTADKEDWIAQHFFTGGIMPSHGLIRHVADVFELEADWRWNGTHYARTARDWLANFDREDVAVSAVLREVYGADAALWKRRWRLFFLATAGLFGHAGGEEWGVSHYRLRPL
jgi:cyclopropane-fatty-acyl-phospholipid synthase